MNRLTKTFLVLWSTAGAVAAQDTRPASAPTASPAAAPATLEETRLSMGKWMETQQIISRERKEWQQGREILANRVELLRQEAASLSEKIKTAEAAAAETERKKAALEAETAQLKATSASLVATVGGFEADVKKLFKTLPDAAKKTPLPLFQRIPENPAEARVSVAERFQNVLGVMNALNKTNTEINVEFEVRNLADGKPAEVKAVYVGLAQGYFVSPSGEGGIGRPGPDGWRWEPAGAAASDINYTLDVIAGKHKPAFVPLPVKIQ